MRKVLIILIFLVINTPLAMATVVTFDDVSTTPTEAQIPNGYAGFNWDNFWVVNKDAFYPGAHYSEATVSGNYTGFNGYQLSASILSSSVPITFDGAWFTSAFDNTLSITIQGFSGNSPVQSSTIQLTNTGPTWFNAEWAGVDKIVFTPFGGATQNYFAVDDFTYTASSQSVPEPGTVWLLCIALGCLAAFRNRLLIAQGAMLGK